MSHEPRFGCSLVLWTWWALQNLTFKGKVMNGSRFSSAIFLFWFFQNGHFVVVGSLKLLETYRHGCWRRLLLLLSNGDLTTKKRFTYEKINRDPFVTLHLNVQFWSAHHVHGTKLQPKGVSCELNSIKVKSFAISNVGTLEKYLNNSSFPEPR